MQGGGAVTVGGDRQEAAVSFEQYLSFSESEYLDGADIKENSRNADGVDAVYYLKRPDMLSAFESELRVKGLPNNYAVKTDESTFERVAAPVESLNKLSLTFLIIVMIMGAVIMILLSVIAVRERKYEIGVLRAMGMKKKNVAVSLWVEIIAITCICFTLGMCVGTVLSQPVSDAMMTGQVQSSNSGSTTLADRLNANEETQIENINVSLDIVTALEIFGISIILASIAGIISVSRITKSEPIKILMERN
jgi:putative ABC transport system permease protein